MINYVVQPGGSLSGNIKVAGDKSISHRSIIFGSLSEGVTKVKGFLEGEDALATMNAFRAMGVTIHGPDNGVVEIHGVGLNGLKAPEKTIDCGNSGTTMRLLSGLLSAQPFDSTLIGDSSLMRRPMKRVSEPLSKMGANIQPKGENGRPPVEIKANTGLLNGFHYDMPMASAQVKSALLLAGLFANGTTSITEPAPTRDHTERMLNGFGYPVKVDGNKISVEGKSGSLKATDIVVPSDISSAAFFIVGASISPNSHICLKGVGLNPTRTGIIDILKLMGANIVIENQHDVGGEPVGDIVVRYAPLTGIQIPEHLVPLAIDEFPAIFIACANATGESVLTGAEELRVKESDRIQVMADGLKAIGIEHEVLHDGIRIVGNDGGEYHGAEIDSHGDHRIAMSFVMASLRAKSPMFIKNCANVATSFPNFVELAQHAGITLQIQAD